MSADDGGRPGGRGYRATKCFEGQGPVLIWAVTAADRHGAYHKVFLVADAAQRSFGVRLEAARTDDIKVNGAVVALLRKHAKTAGIGQIYRDPQTADLWIPLFSGPGPAPAYWVQLAQGLPPELRLIDQQGVVLVRKSSQGSYTKRYQLPTPLPAYPAAAPFEAVTLALPGDAGADGGATVGALRSAEGERHDDGRRDEDDPHDGKTAESHARNNFGSPSDSPAATPGSTPPSAELLPDYQRQARDRLARRLKTVRKSQTKLGDQAAAAAQQATLQREAVLLQNFIGLIKPGAFELVLPAAMTGEPTDVRLELDPEISPGLNVERRFIALKKARRASEALAARESTVGGEVATMAADLELLRGTTLSLARVEQIMRRYRLVERQVVARPGAAASDDHKPYRTFLWPTPESTLGTVQAAPSTSPSTAPAAVTSPFATSALGARAGERPTTPAKAAAKPASLYKILVGKTAHDSDELCRSAKGNDLWIHVVGTTGSHVIIPARQLRQGVPAGLLRAAAILALHFSKLRGDLRGEVYVGRRQGIRKRKGMAPGLWQIDQAETVFCKYEEAELEALLASTQQAP